MFGHLGTNPSSNVVSFQKSDKALSPGPLPNMRLNMWLPWSVIFYTHLKCWAIGVLYSRPDFYMITTKNHKITTETKSFSFAWLLIRGSHRLDTSVSTCITNLLKVMLLSSECAPLIYDHYGYAPVFRYHSEYSLQIVLRKTKQADALFTMATTRIIFDSQ